MPQQQQQETIREEAQATLKKLEARDPGLRQFLKKAHAYAVFPAVGKAAVVVGGALGHGAVFEKGKFVGYATLSQLTIGVQVGGDTFVELVVFDSPESFERFKKGKTAFSANASAVLVKAGKAGTKDFDKGAAALAYTKGGMLLELSIGGQRFKYKAADEAEEEQDDGKHASGKSKSAAAGKAEGRAGKGDESDEGEEEGQDEEGVGILSRATGGIRKAASRAGGMVKDHPVAAALVAAGLAGAALLAARALRNAGSDQEEGSESEDGENGAEDRAESGSEDGDESEQESQGSEEDESKHDMLGFLRRRRTRA